MMLSEEKKDRRTRADLSSAKIRPSFCEKTSRRITTGVKKRQPPICAAVASREGTSSARRGGDRNGPWA